MQATVSAAGCSSLNSPGKSKPFTWKEGRIFVEGKSPDDESQGRGRKAPSYYYSGFNPEQWNSSRSQAPHGKEPQYRRSSCGGDCSDRQGLVQDLTNFVQRVDRVPESVPDPCLNLGDGRDFSFPYVSKKEGFPGRSSGDPAATGRVPGFQPFEKEKRHHERDEKPERISMKTTVS
jgi:hypothetical protein